MTRKNSVIGRIINDIVKKFLRNDETIIQFLENSVLPARTTAQKTFKSLFAT